MTIPPRSVSGRTLPTHAVVDATMNPVGDEELEGLIYRVYVEGGFTHADVAASLLTAAAVRRRGRLLVVRDPVDDSLVGAVIVVAPDSPARRIATKGEAEMHLLAVSPERRNAGIGRTLVNAALESARRDGYFQMVLWTQVTMRAAHHLYERAGFVRSPDRDFQRDGRTFLVYRIAL